MLLRRRGRTSRDGEREVEVSLEFGLFRLQAEIVVRNRKACCEEHTEVDTSSLCEIRVTDGTAIDS